jgi:hypothetical protein
MTITTTGTEQVQERQLVQTNPLAMSTWGDVEAMANHVAKSGMFGITNPAQAICMFAIAQSEGIDPLSVLKKYHFIENKPSMRADAMLAEFKKAGGGVIYHIRTDKIVAATYFEDKKKITAQAEGEAKQRMRLILDLQMDEMEPSDRKEKYLELVDLNKEGVQTIVRTLDDAVKKGITQGKNGMKNNWAQNPRAMLAARCDTEGIRIIMPGLIAGIMETSEAIDVAETEKFHAEQSPEEKLAEADRIVEEAMSLPKGQRQERFAVASEMRTQALDEQIEKEEKEKQQETYVLRHVGGIYKGMAVSDVATDDLTILLESLERRAEKNPDLYSQEVEAIKSELATREGEKQ